jgi:hypothetical protein
MADPPQPQATALETSKPVATIEEPIKAAAEALETSKPEPLIEKPAEAAAEALETSKPEPSIDETAQREAPKKPKSKASDTQKSKPEPSGPEEPIHPESGPDSQPISQDGPPEDDFKKYLGTDGLPDFAALAQDEGPLLPSRPIPVSMDEPTSAKEMVMKLLDLPQVKNLKALLPGKFKGYATYSPFDPNLPSQDYLPKLPEETTDETTAPADEEAEFFEPENEEDGTD